MHWQKRIVISGVEKGAILLKTGSIGAVVTMMPRQEYETHPLRLEYTRQMRVHIQEQNIPQYFSKVFDQENFKYGVRNCADREALTRQSLKRALIETVETIDHFLNKTPEDKQLLLHCAVGEDRSATAMVLYLLYKYGSIQHINRAFAEIYKMVPQASAYHASECIEAWFGKFESPINTAMLYTTTITNANILRGYSEPTAEHRNGKTTYCFNLQTLAAGDRWDAIEKIELYNRAAPRFGMPIFTIAS